MSGSGVLLLQMNKMSDMSRVLSNPVIRWCRRALRQGFGALAVGVSTLAVSTLAHAATPAAATPPEAVLTVPAPEVAARAYILLDLSSDQVLSARQADAKVEPASLTKLMTAYLVFQALEAGKLRMDQALPVSERAWRTGMTGASRTFIKLGSQVSVEDLIKGMIVQSGNDATTALAEGVGGSVEQFVDMMNRQAQRMGLKHTQFKNPEGLTAPGHQSTARELATIARRLITDFPNSLPYYRMKSFTYNGIAQSNRNLLLWRDPTVDGLKTGFTDAAGYCLIATARREVLGVQRRLLSVVVGTASPEARANESQKLLNWGYSAFETVKLFEANQPVTQARVWKGAANTVLLGRTTPLVLAVPRGMASKLQTRVVRSDPLMAPLAAGQQVGTLKVTVAGQAWQDIPLTALREVPSAGWLGRTWDALRLAVE